MLCRTRKVLSLLSNTQLARLERGGILCTLLLRQAENSTKLKKTCVLKSKNLMQKSVTNLTLAKDSDKMTVEAKVVAQEKQPKVVVFHYKAKKQIRKKQGHRQPYTEIQITNIAV